MKWTGAGIHSRISFAARQRACDIKKRQNHNLSLITRRKLGNQ